MIDAQEFGRLYELTGGFMPHQSPNDPLLSEDGISTYYDDLEDGCRLFVENNPNFFGIIKSGLE